MSLQTPVNLRVALEYYIIRQRLPPPDDQRVRVYLVIGIQLPDMFDDEMK